MHEALGSDPESRYPNPHKAQKTLCHFIRISQDSNPSHPRSSSKTPPQLMSATRYNRDHAGPRTVQHTKRLFFGAKAALHFTPPSLLAHRNPKDLTMLPSTKKKKRASSQTFWYRPLSPTPAKSMLRTGLSYSCLYASDQSLTAKARGKQAHTRPKNKLSRRQLCPVHTHDLRTHCPDDRCAQCHQF